MAVPVRRPRAGGDPVSVFRKLGSRLRGNDGRRLVLGFLLVSSGALAAPQADPKLVELWSRMDEFQAARGVATGGCCGGGCDDPITSNLYSSTETDSLPSDAVRASLGCGNPTALAELKAGQTVLDLGSGGGIDVLLSARRVGPTD